MYSEVSRLVTERVTSGGLEKIRRLVCVEEPFSFFTGDNREQQQGTEWTVKPVFFFLASSAR